MTDHAQSRAGARAAEVLAAQSRAEQPTDSRGVAAAAARAEGRAVERYGALLEEARHDVQAAGVHLHDLFATDVNRMIWRLVGNDQDHDDLVNEVFVRLLRDIRQVREAAALRSWVFRVTINIVRGELRKRAMFRRFFVMTERSPDDFGGTTPDHETRELLARTFSVLDRISPEDRIVFVLHYLEEKPLREVCALCGCSNATARRRLARARKRFALFAERDADLRYLLDKGRRDKGEA